MGKQSQRHPAFSSTCTISKAWRRKSIFISDPEKSDYNPYDK
jgi:hypothetical protein